MLAGSGYEAPEGLNARQVYFSAQWCCANPVEVDLEQIFAGLQKEDLIVAITVLLIVRAIMNAAADGKGLLWVVQRNQQLLVFSPMISKHAELHTPRSSNCFESRSKPKWSNWRRAIVQLRRSSN